MQRATASGIPLPEVARPGDVPADLAGRLGEPGRPPYTRGIYPRMYLERPWTIRQLAGFGAAADTNRRYRFLLERGATGINAVFDYPSLRAFDSDDEWARSDAGRGGVAVDVVGDFADLFAGIALDEVSVSLVSSQPIGAVPHLAMYLAAAEACGFDRRKLRGTSQNDFLMETCITIAPKALPPRASFRLECDLAEYCIRHLPRWNPLSITGYNYRESGADAIYELALTLAHGEAVGAELLGRGLPPALALSRISFFLSANNDFFEEIAKFRAARRMWAHIVADRLGVADEKAGMFRYHVQTAGATAAPAQVLVNVARSALQGLAAVLGGTQSLHVNGYDEALAIPSEQAAQVALRTQQVLLHESGVAGSVDPLAGSYLVEYLTDELERRVEEVLDVIRGQGGLVAATENGWVHGELSRLAYAHQRGLDDGTIPFVGVNLGVEEEATQPELFELPAGTLARQAERLAETRNSRDPAAHARALDAVRLAARAGSNVVPPVLDAARAGATVGEVGTAFRDVLGDWVFPLW